MNTHRRPTPTAGAWPWLMSEARSALPEAPVVADVERPVAAGQRHALALALRRMADLLEPRYRPRPLPDSPAPC